MKQWLIEMWDKLLWLLGLIRTSKHSQERWEIRTRLEADLKAALDFKDTLQRQLAALQEQVRQSEADRLIKAGNAHTRRSEAVKKAWQTRKENAAVLVGAE